MCGIVGKVKLNGAGVDHDQLRAMTACVEHRGPDDSGLYISPNHHVGLGHQRLAILDLSAAGHQPMSYRRRYTIVYNGELYNFPALKQQLQHDGYTFQSQTDTEVIMAMYDRYQADCLTYFRGMFAFAIYDAQTNLLFCARDRAGQKPFKYFFDGTTFLFASELKAILTQREYTRRPDYTAIHHYLTYQFVPAPRTGFEGIKKLEPGCHLTLNLNTRQLTLKRYWQLDFSQQTTLSRQQWQRQIIDTLEEATAMQMLADVPLGAFLSGGVDSSAIVALMSRHATKPLKTFSIGFPDDTLNELPYARQVAQHFHTEHTEFEVTPQAVEILPELVAGFEEPYADSSAIPTYYLSKLARQHVTVALNGDGGDENFAGYPRYAFHKLALTLDQLGVSHLPGIRGATRWLQAVWPTTFTMRAARFAESLSDEPLRRYVTYLCYFTNAMKAELYQPAFARRLASLDSYDVLASRLATSHATLFDQALEADIATYLPDDLLVKVDIASMMNGLEARSPFLDHKFMELTARLPAALKLKGLRHHKYLLKEALRPLLPAPILRRPKMGFVVPIERWFRGDMRQYLQSILLDPQAYITQELFRPQAVKALLKQHTTTATNLAPPLWALLTLELWFKRYFP